MAHVDLGGTSHEASFRMVETYRGQSPRGWQIALDPRFSPTSSFSLLIDKVRGRSGGDNAAKRKESE
jgi:hypothetical protein